MAFKQEQLKVKEMITTKILTLAAEPPTILDPIAFYIIKITNLFHNTCKDQ